MIILMYLFRAFDKIQLHFMIKNIQHTGIKGYFPILIKDLYKIPTANIINGERVNAFP